MKPATKTPSNSLQIRLSPVGTLVRVVGRIPQRTKVLCVLGLSALGVGSAAILATVATPPETTLEGNRSAAYDFVSGDPALMAGVSPTDLPEDALAKIFLVMPSFDAWLADQIDSDIGALLTNESLRLAEAAQKEASEGAIDTADPVADIDLKGCLQQMTAPQCVLLRYAADGLKTYHEATDKGDVCEAMGGVLRYRAALAALYPVEQRQPQTQLTLKGLKNYRLSMFDIARLLPASLGPTVEFRAPLGDTSPAATVEQGVSD
jgi:hypothetical protein